MHGLLYQRLERVTLLVHRQFLGKKFGNFSMQGEKDNFHQVILHQYEFRLNRISENSVKLKFLWWSSLIKYNVFQPFWMAVVTKNHKSGYHSSILH